MSFSDPGWLQTERALVARVRSGDRAAFAELYRAFAAPLFGAVLLPSLGDRAVAEDALADTFQTVLERLHRWDDRGVSIWRWLKEIAVNKARDVHRARER